MTSDDETLVQEAKRATEMLKGKVVAAVWRHRMKEIVIEFTDGTRLFVDHNSKGLELSITGQFDEEISEG